MNWSTDYRPRNEQPAPLPPLEQAIQNLRRQLQSGGFIMLTREQAEAVIAKAEQQ